MIPASTGLDSARRAVMATVRRSISGTRLESRTSAWAACSASVHAPRRVAAVTASVSAATSAPKTDGPRSSSSTKSCAPISTRGFDPAGSILGV